MRGCRDLGPQNLATSLNVKCSSMQNIRRGRFDGQDQVTIHTATNSISPDVHNFSRCPIQSLLSNEIFPSNSHLSHEYEPCDLDFTVLRFEENTLIAYEKTASKTPRT